jgi:hypothetical protein
MNINFGQMNETTERWKLIQKIIKNNKFKTIVEIGTWKGMGSTLSILKSIDEDTEFYSLESNLSFYEIAKKNLSDYITKFNLIYGRIVESESLIRFTDNLILTDEQKKWLYEDIENMNNCDNVLSKLPESIDFLLLDGGEYSTYEEWKILNERSNIIALDDIKTFKCKKIYQEMTNDYHFEKIEETTEGNGFCIFKKII